jgi:(2Fe-2S) ferredoxin
MNNKDLARKAKLKGVGLSKGDTVAHHFLLCTGPNCQPEVGKQTLKVLNKKCKALREEGVSVFVTEVKCFRLCRMGPIAVVYPDDIWYRDVTPDNAKRIVDEHLAGGKVVEELAFLRDPLHVEKTAK